MEALPHGSWIRRGRVFTMLLLLLFGAVAGYFVSLAGAHPTLSIVIGMVSGIFFALLLIGIEVIFTREISSFVPTLVFSVVAGFAGALVFAPVIFAVMYSLVGKDATSEASFWSAFALLFVAAIYGFAYLFARMTFQLKDNFKFVIPFMELRREGGGKIQPLVIDSSAIIDGRLVELARTGILQGEVLLPRFILAELHALADSKDRMKRQKGRRGLDLLQNLQSNPSIALRIHEAKLPDIPEVDSKLVFLAKEIAGRIVTTDANLEKVAAIQEVPVVNVNDIARTMKPPVMPGEELQLQIVKAGEEPGQGVGYLEDGTMVVAEGAKQRIGSEVRVAVTSAIQTSAGKMIFGKTLDS